MKGRLVQALADVFTYYIAFVVLASIVFLFNLGPDKLNKK